MFIGLRRIDLGMCTNLKWVIFLHCVNRSDVTVKSVALLPSSELTWLCTAVH